MTVATSRSRPRTWAGSAGRSVMLATLGVPLDRDAATFAVDSAVEAGRELIVVNVTVLEPLGLSMILGYDALPEFTPEVSSSLDLAVGLARSLGVGVERVRIRSPRPAEALVQLVHERRPGVLVFGPRTRPGRDRRARRALARIRDEVDCMLWYPSELDDPIGPSGAAGRRTPTS